MNALNTRMILEWFGIGASLLVALSLTMQNIRRLRTFNLIGSIAFAAYGAGIHSASVVILNFFTVGVNVYYLIRMRRRDKGPHTFAVSRVDPGADIYVRRFVDFHSQDICRFFPSFNPDFETGTLAGADCYFILRETLPVSLIAFRKGPDSEIAILLDYAVPAFRDYRNAKFFFETAVKEIAAEGDVFVAKAEVPVHKTYLKRLGFEEVEKTDGGVLFSKQVSWQKQQARP
ncbi:MAG: hypothetical protein LBK40_01585 [Spirochaetaceae bacterium]|jgi:hypothetical protein|nr:hypothetical protein [Spirochaetaceae bacterium]